MAIDLQHGTVVEGYRLEHLLGSGGFGAVWRATSLVNGRDVAMKFLHASVNRDGERRFKLEARILADLSHPHCVTLLAHGRIADGPHYLVTEYLKGRTLAQWAEGGRTPAEAVYVARQIGEALLYAHDRGVVHRDLKPANVLIVEAIGAPPIVKVLDFGLAKMIGVERLDITKTGELIGTAGFMSPEQMLGRRDIGPATDQYCLGVILFELLTGKHPFAGDTPLALVMAHLREPVPPLGPAVLAPLAAIVVRLLQKAPEARFRSMRDVVDAFDQCFDPGPSVPSAVPAASPTPVVASSDGPSTRALFIGGLALVVGALAIIAVAIPRNDVPSRPAALPPVSTVQPNPLAEPAPEPDVVDSNQAAPNIPDVPTSETKSVRGTLRYYPRGEDAADYVAVVGLLTPGRSVSEQKFLRYINLFDQADREGLILAVPSPNVDGIRHSWLPDDIDAARTAVLRVGVEHELPVFILGGEQGADAARAMACTFAQPGKIGAIAITGHRDYVDEEFTCATTAVPVPVLHLAQTKSRFVPVEGGHRCGDARPVVSLDAQEAYWRTLNGCSGPEREWRGRPTPQGRCITWSCATPFVSCRVEGGLFWPGMDRTDIQECHGEPATQFPYQKVVWDFFAEQLPDSRD